MYCHRIVVSEEHPNAGVDLPLCSLKLGDSGLIHAESRGAFGLKAKQCPVLRPCQEPIEALPEPGHGRRVGLADAVDVGAEQDQAAGTALAVGGGEAGLGAADLAGEGGALSALGLLERLFLRREFLREGRLPGQELLQFVLWLHLGRR